MALRVWLPLNGSLENRGVSDVIVTNTNGVIDNNGKIGKCYTFGTGTSYLTIPKEAMTEFSTECSVSFWLKIISWNTNYATFFQAGLGSTAWNNYIFGFLRNNANSTICFTISNGSTASNASYLTSTMELNRWYHVALTYSTGKCSIYLDGALDHEYTTTIVPAFSSITTITTGICNNKGSYQTNCSMNDLRIYDHCLSAKEVKEIAQGLVLHYKLNGWSGGAGENLLSGSKDLSGATVSGTKTLNDYQDFASSTYDNSSGTSYHELLAWNSVTTVSANEKWTASFYAKSPVSAALHVYFYNNNSGIVQVASGISSTGSTTTSTDGGISIPLTTSWQRYWITWTFNSTTTAATKNLLFRCLAGRGSISVCGVKLEKGDKATNWTPTIAEMGVDKTKITDSSGFGNDGTVVNTTTEDISTDGRYQVCTNFLGTTVDTTSNTITGAQYLYASLPMPAWSALTLAWWGNNIAYGRGGIFETTGTTGNIWEGSDYSTTAIANWDSTFGIYNGSTRVNIFSNFVKDSTWHYHIITFDGANVKYYCDGTLKQTSALTGTLPAITGFKIGLGRAGGVYRQIKQKMSDLRIYTTALSAEDILDLYHTPANIDDLDGMHGFEFVEDNNNSISKNGVVHNGNISQYSALSYLKYDPNIYFEPDGSTWVHIYHHNHPDLASFASTDTFSTSVKKDDNRWFNATEVCNQLNEWEFLVKYCYTEGGTIYKERWIQTKNPEAAVFGDVDAADITRITGDGYKTGTWGGLYKKNGSAYWVMNNGNSGNWWGATGSFSIYQGGIPGYGGTVTTTGYNDLYVRIDNIDFSNLANAKITANNLYLANNFIEK